MEFVRYLLGILPTEAAKDWLKSKGIPVSLVIAVVLVVYLLGWCSAQSSRKTLAAWLGSVKNLWLRFLARVLRGPQVTAVGEQQRPVGSPDREPVARNGPRYGHRVSAVGAHGPDALARLHERDPLAVR